MKTLFAFLTIAVIIIPVTVSAKTVGIDSQIKIEDGVHKSSDSGGSSSSGEPELMDDSRSGVEVHTSVSGSLDDSVSHDANDDSKNGVKVSITGDPDFDLFVKTVKSNDEHVDAVKVDDEGSVDVSYKHDGRLFGFIPVKLTSHTSVMTDTNGKASVVVRMPWWSFLVSGASDVKSKIESEVENDSRITTHAEADVSMDSRVKLVEVLVSSVAKADAAVKASYNVKANVK